MYEYIFLFAVAALWTLFAVVQDVKFTEISDWLTFSLLVICLGYRAVYGFYAEDIAFFGYGVLGSLVFLVLGYAFYYGKFFAGGDAKLLIAYGAVLPFERMFDYFSVGGFFVLSLFLIGALYSLIFSGYFAYKRSEEFKKGFVKTFNNNRKWVFLGVFVALAFLFVDYIACLIVLIVGALFLYLRSVDKYCMIRLTKPSDLMEGDWIINDIRVGGKIVRSTVHGLTKEDIALLRKHKKSIIVKQGVPFAPCFFLALVLFTVVFFSLQGDFSRLLLPLFSLYG